MAIFLENARAAGLSIAPTAPFYLNLAPRPELILGYGNYTEAQLREGVAKLRGALLVSRKHRFVPASPYGGK